MNGQLYISTNSGVTWTATHSTDKWRCVCASADFSRIIAATQLTYKLAISSNSGSTFSDTTIANSVSNFNKCAMSSNGQNFILAPHAGNAIISTNGGTSLGNLNYNTGVMPGVSMSSDGVRVAFTYSVGGIGSIGYSTNSGTSFSTTSLNKGWKGIASSSNGTHLVAITNGEYIYLSTDGGQTWTATATDTPRGWNAVCCSKDFMIIVAVVNGGQIYVSRDAGNTFTAKDSNRAWEAVYCNNDGTKFTAAVLNGFLYTSF